MVYNSWLYSSAKLLTLLPVVSSCLSLAARIWKGGWLGRGKNQLESWPGRVVVNGSCCTWWPVGDTGSLQDSGLALPCSSSLAMAWGGWHRALSGLQGQQTGGPVAVLGRWACGSLINEAETNSKSCIYGRVSCRSTVWGPSSMGKAPEVLSGARRGCAISILGVF